MTKTKRVLVFALALTAFVCLMCSCGKTADTTAPGTTSAYDTPEQFISLPSLAEVTGNKTELEEALADELEAFRTDLYGKHFTKLDASAIAINGDKLNIHYTGTPTDKNLTLSDESIKGMTNASNELGYNLILGSDSFIEGFEPQLIGCKAGDTVNVIVTFPDDYENSTELRGVEVNFVVKVNSVSRLLVESKHDVIIEHSASLKDGSKPEALAEIIDTTESVLSLHGDDDDFAEVFLVSDISKYLLGKHLYETLSFTLTLPAEKAVEYSYGDESVELVFSVKIESIENTPETITDEMVCDYTGGEYRTLSSFSDYILSYLKRVEAFDAVRKYATYPNALPDYEYSQYYDNYYDNAIYDKFGDISGKTDEEKKELLTDEVVKELEEISKQNAEAATKDRFLIEYLFDVLKIEITDEQYSEKLSEMYNSAIMNNYYLYYVCPTVEAFEEYYGKEYMKLQVLYEFMLDKLATVIEYK